MLNNGLRWDWCRKLEKCLNIPPLNYQIWPAKLKEFQTAFGLEPTGFVDAPTRIQLARHFPDLGIVLIGQNLDPRCILALTQPHEIFCDCVEAILMAQDAYIPQVEAVPAILAIRGVELRPDGFWQTASAKEFAENSYGGRTHFCSKNGASDSAFFIFWRENGEKHCTFYPGTVNPNAIWPHGTAHLNHGTYFYRIGRHRTREPDHIQAVETMVQRQNWDKDWVYDRTADSIQYLALESVSQIEVIRSNGDSLDISSQDVERALQAIAVRDPTFVDAMRIKINIHSCALDHASSLGCQNIPPQCYGRFMAELLRLQELQREKYGVELPIPYCLTDASQLAISNEQ